MSFTIRQLNDTETLGAKLKALRHMANRTISEMAEATKIHSDILKALEQNAFDRLPEPLYTRQFLKTYVKSLKGDVTYFIDRFETECGTCDFTDQARLPRKRIKKSNFFVTSSFIKTGLLIFIFLALASYIGLEFKQVITAPDLTVIEPKDEYVSKEATINVSGTTEKRATILVNGQSVLLNQNATFETEIPLRRGLNIIEIEASKRYSRKEVIYRRVIFEQE